MPVRHWHQRVGLEHVYPSLAVDCLSVRPQALAEHLDVAVRMARAWPAATFSKVDLPQPVGPNHGDELAPPDHEVGVGDRDVGFSSLVPRGEAAG